MRMGVVAQSAREVKTPIEFYKLYFRNEMINNITDYTNIYINENRDKFIRERECICYISRS